MAKGQAPQAVSAAIQKASARTGVDFAYLMNQARTESSYNPAAKAKTSSASGLFQFLDRTWLDMVNRYGDKYGLSAYADQIDDSLRVGNKSAKQDILALRNDPQISSYMAAEFAADNKDFLERTVGGDIGSTELYLAHFLGPAGASGFLKEMNHNPMTIAADIMPQAARANRNVFYDSATGQPRTLQQVYNFFDKKFSTAPAMPQQMIAQDDAAQEIAAQDSPAAPARSPVYLRRAAPQEELSPVYIRQPQAASSLASILSQDQVPRSARDLDDYRDNAHKVPAIHRSASAQKSSMSIADMLMLSAVDL